jgi:uncharacterized protein YbcI
METQTATISRPPSLGHQARPALELQEVTNAMVRIYKELLGRGPTKARSAYAGPDTLIATLEDSLTPAEHNLIAIGEQQKVRDARALLQQASERTFVETVERATGRRVRAWLSGIDTRSDVSTEVFHLEPAVSAESVEVG